MPKLYPTRLTFSDIQRSEYSAKTPIEGAKMEFPQTRRCGRVIGRESEPRVWECVPVVNQYERW